MALPLLIRGAIGAAKFAVGGTAGRQMAIGGALGFATGGEGHNNPNLDFEARMKSAAFGAIGTGLFMKAPSILGRAAKGAVNARGIKQAHKLSQNPIGPRYQSGAFSSAAGLGPQTQAAYQASSVSHQLFNSPLGKLGKGAGRMGMGIGSAIERASNFAMQHPKTAGAIALGATAGIAGMYGASSYDTMSSPTLSGAKVNTEYDRQQAAMTEMTGGTGGLAGSPIGPAPAMMGRYHKALQQSTDGLVQGLHKSRH